MVFQGDSANIEMATQCELIFSAPTRRKSPSLFFCSQGLNSKQILPRGNGPYLWNNIASLNSTLELLSVPEVGFPGWARVGFDSCTDSRASVYTIAVSNRSFGESDYPLSFEGQKEKLTIVDKASFAFADQTSLRQIGEKIEKAIFSAESLADECAVKWVSDQYLALGRAMPGISMILDRRFLLTYGASIPEQIEGLRVAKKLEQNILKGTSESLKAARDNYNSLVLSGRLYHVNSLFRQHFGIDIFTALNKARECGL